MANPFEKAAEGNSSGGIEDALKYLVSRSPALTAFSNALQQLGLLGGEDTNPIAPLPQPVNYSAQSNTSPDQATNKPQPSPQPTQVSLPADPGALQPMTDSSRHLQPIAPALAPEQPTTPEPARGKVYDPFGTKVAGKDQSQLPKGAMVMSPQEKHLYDTHRDNLLGPGGVDNPDGTRSSLFIKTFDIDGKTYTLPTVYDGKVVSDQEAINRAHQIGIEKFPAYANPQKAQDRYMQLHQYMEQDTQNFMKARDELQRRFRDMPPPGSMNPAKASPMSMRQPADMSENPYTPQDELRNLEGEMNYQNSRPARTDPATGAVMDTNQSPNGQEHEDSWQRWQQSPPERKANWIDPARLQRNEQQVRMHGDPETLRTVALDPILSELQREAIGFLSRNGEFTGGGNTRLAGNVTPLPINPGPNAGPTNQSARFGWGLQSDPKVQSIGKPVMQQWLNRTGERYRNKK